MALLSIYRGTQAEVSERPVSDGALLFATDTKKIYLDNGSRRVEMSSLQDLSDYITSTQLSSAIGAEASARQKQDQLLEQAIDDKLGADDIIAGSNVQISHDEESGHITISATDTKDTNTTYTLTKSGSTITLTGSDGSKTSVTDADTNTTYGVATSSANGLMSSTDKTKLDGIASGANKYTLPPATSSVLGGVKTGANITNSSGTISLTKANVTSALGYTPPTADTNTWIAFKGATTSTAGTAGYAPAPAAGAANRYLRSDGTWQVPPDTNTTYTLSSFGITATAEELNHLDGITATATELNYMDGVTSNVQSQLNGKAASSHTHSNATMSAAGFLPKLGGGTTNFLRADGTWAKPPDTNTTYSNMTGATSSVAGKAGLVPAPAAGSATRYLRSDGTWQVPPDTNTTYTLSSFGITATAAELNYMDGVTSNVQTQLNGKAASSHNHSAANITSGTLAVARGGTGITSNPSMLVNLGSTSAASVFATSPKPGITGTLAIAHGGTGATSAASARSNIGAAASDIIAVQSTQPSGSTCKLWIQIQSMGISVLFRYAHFYYMQIRFLENKYRDKRSDE